MSYIILRGRWCVIIVLNGHATTEDKIDDIVTDFINALPGSSSVNTVHYATVEAVSLNECL
jgi:hypothetical protein